MINKLQEESNIDDLINQIKHQHGDEKKETVNQSNNNANSSDNLLQQFKSNFQQQKGKSQPHNLTQKKPEVNENLQQFKSKFQQQKQKSPQHKLTRNKPEVNENLHQFKQKFQQKQEAEREKFTHQNQEEIRYTEQRKQQQQKLLTRQAKKWLENLDEYSDEGLWFESFSHNYPSRLEAAIEYLAVLNASP